MVLIMFLSIMNQKLMTAPSAPQLTHPCLRITSCVHRYLLLIMKSSLYLTICFACLICASPNFPSSPRKSAPLTYSLVFPPLTLMVLNHNLGVSVTHLSLPLPHHYQFLKNPLIQTPPPFSPTEISNDYATQI